MTFQFFLPKTKRTTFTFPSISVAAILKLQLRSQSLSPEIPAVHKGSQFHTPRFPKPCMKCSQPARHHTKSQTFKLNDRPLQFVFTTLAITPLLRQLDTPFYHGFTIFADIPSFRCVPCPLTPSPHAQPCRFLYFLETIR